MASKPLLPAIVQIQPDSQPIEAPSLRIFISYASEDLKIAHAVASGLSDALFEGFAEVWFDKWFMHAGDEVKTQIKTKLEKADILIIISTNVEKPTHSFTGWEVGYYDALIEKDPGRKRKIIPLFLEELPATVKEYNGLSFKMPRELLKQSLQEFTAQNRTDKEDRMCQLISDLQQRVLQLLLDAHYAVPILRDRHDPALCVQNIRLAIFIHLKTTVERVIKPQKQITIKTTGTALAKCEHNLPLDALIVPVGGAAMNIFGLADVERRWEDFLKLLPAAHQDSWREAITTVVIAAEAERIDADNSQIVLSYDETKTYRVVLTTATRFWDDNREFSIYFVETLKREDYGDAQTSLALKALESVCRYRFLFLEEESQFSAENLQALPDVGFVEMAGKLRRELLFMRKEGKTLGLDQPNVWRRFTGWELIQQMVTVYGEREPVILEAIASILNATATKGDLKTPRNKLTENVRLLEEETRDINSKLVNAIAIYLTKAIHLKRGAITG